MNRDVKSIYIMIFNIAQVGVDKMRLFILCSLCNELGITVLSFGGIDE